MKAAKVFIFTLFCVFGFALGEDDATDVFAGDLMKVIYGQNDVKQNTVVSPVSLYDAVALLQQGTGGNSLAELTEALHADAPTTRQRYSTLIRSLKGPHSRAQLEFANKVYLENNFKIEDSFRSVATQEFQAEIDNIEFSRNVEAADAINQWVSDSTHGRIKDLVTADSLSSDTVMVLLNAVFFAGNWTYQFSPYETKDSPFTTLDSKEKSVPMMHLSENLVAGEIREGDINAKFVRLPFQGNEFSMIFVVPNEVNGLENLVNGLQEQHLSSILSHSEKRNVELSLPKFKFSTTSELIPVLQKLGVHDIFGSAANLTGIAKSDSLYVSEIKQKAEIEVDERGATAAAATSVIGGKTTSVEDSYPRITITADHPFVFYLIDDSSSADLFSGWVADP